MEGHSQQFQKVKQINLKSKGDYNLILLICGWGNGLQFILGTANTRHLY